MQGNVSKDQWVELFREIGLTEADMDCWHRTFEKRHPEGHAGFLEWLGLSPAEIDAIRRRYRQPGV